MNLRLLTAFSILMFFGLEEAKAQITVDNTITAEELVTEYLVGGGVQISNVTFNGLPGNQAFLQLGLYEGVSNVIGFEQGIVLASADVQVVAGGITQPIDGVTNDPDLVAISGFNINNGAILEFDFLSTSDSIRFNYVFASTEYPGFTCSDFNDSFGFFLSGPGISGPYTNGAINIALIPGTETPVAINTVNSGTASGGYPASNCAAANPNWIEDSQYFVPNNAMPINDVQYPGMTVTLTAEADVDCGEWYHIKLAIGDAVDFALQSGVFIEAGSFSAFGEVFVNLSPTIGGAVVVEPQYADVLVAGCSEVQIELTRPEGLTVDSIFVEFGGTAIIDEDYQLGENDTLFFFPEGVDTLFFSIVTLWDGVAGESEFLDIFVYYQDGCGSYDTAFASIEIVDPYFMESTTEDVELFCPAEFVSISATASNGISPYIYNWGFQGIGQTVQIEVPQFLDYYVVMITDQCGFETKLDSVLVTNSIPPPLQATIAPFIQPTCPNETVNLQALVADGNGDYTYLWSDGFSAFPDEPEITVNYIFDRNITLTVTDTCGTQVEVQTLVMYPIYDSLKVNFDPLTNNCPKQPVPLEANITGGAPDVQFIWAEENGQGEFTMDQLAQNTAVIPVEGLNVYTVAVTDRCFRQGFFGINPGYASFTDSLKVIKLDNLPNVLSPNGDNHNDYFVVPGIDQFTDARLEIYDRWGKMIFETSNYMAGSPEFKPKDAFEADGYEDGTYFYIINVDSGECVASGNIEILRGND